MKILLSLLLICSLTIQCAGPPKGVQNTASLPQIIFVPGYYGSYLNRFEDNKRVWFTLGQALWGDQTLARSEDDINIHGAVPLKVDGVFNSISLIPGILSIDIYGKIITSLEEGFRGKANIVAFAYDWRQDITHSAQQLAQLVDSLYSRGAPKVAIVSHSMGGLITSYYLLYGK
jgi:pimeloyl-ACP methyl ester carboxylesterase